MNDRRIHSRMEARRSEMLADVATMVERLLGEYDVLPAAAQVIGSDVADMLADVWGGQNFTMPKDFQRKLGVRDMAVYDAWRAGRPFDALARELGMTERGLRKVIERVRKKLDQARRRAQLDLLEDQ